MKITIVILLYLVSYACFSSNGYEVTTHWRTKSGEVCKAKQWAPFKDLDYANEWIPQLLNVFYYPLVKLDLAYWHTESGVDR